MIKKWTINRYILKYAAFSKDTRVWSPGRRAEGFGIIQHKKSEKVMAPHSSTLAWKIPWTEELGRLQSMGSLRVRDD